MSSMSPTPSVKEARLTHLKVKLKTYEDQRDTQNRVIAELWSEYVKKSEEEAALRIKINSYVKDNTDECKRLEKELERVTGVVLELGVAKSAASAEVRRLTKKIAAKKIKIAVARSRWLPAT
ncbi:uncharacterized protein H6S33_008665 [Morchella sextelata]|uniref:uncharacterized protein n=1 Tax=Morchella sextelata TaxID=1174677 RepID=UPI001D04964B|nr:uncharacterized protein H6S33_008665 [Morchella sextelata]KAH0602584.1 hypothetical protein H6S33_008665 [Morchella sextelata]